MKKVLAVLLATVMLVSLLPMSAVSVSAAKATSGKTGSCTWSLSGTKLTISGNGKMADYNVAEEKYAPWGDEITSVTIKEGVTAIGMGAFYTCLNLKKVTLPESLKTIGELAFCGCVSLSSLTIPEGVRTIGGGAFALCLTMKKITIPHKTDIIGDMAFYSSGLTEIVLPRGVIDVGIMAFAGCVDLKTAVLGQSIYYISEGLFMGCESLRSVTFTDTVELIKESAFSDCTSLIDVYYTGDEKLRDEFLEVQGDNEALTEDAEWHYKAGPIILKDLKTAYVPYGMEATVMVDAIGRNLSYDWWIKDEGETEFRSIINRSYLYSETMSKKIENRQIYCIVRDEYGNSVQTKTALIKPSINLISQPQDSYTAMGEKVKVKAEFEGLNLRYEWWIKNEGQTKYTKSSVTSDTYTVTMSKTSKNRRVLCKAFDPYGNMVKTNSVLLRERVSLTRRLKTVLYTPKGSSVKVALTASGDGLTYTWYVKDIGKTDFVKSSITKSTYSVTMSAKTKGRKVYCVIKDKYGNQSKSDTFFFYEAVSITTQPKTVTVKKNATAKVTVKASGDGLKYTWYIKNKGSSKYSKSSVKSATYSVKMTSKVNGRYLYCVVKDKYGKTVQTKTVQVKMK